MMEYVATTHEFIEKYEADIRKIINLKFFNVLKYDRSYDDVVNAFFVNILKTKAVEKFDPNHPSKIKFSSYMWTILYHYLCAYEFNRNVRDKNHYVKTCSYESKEHPGYSHLDTTRIDDETNIENAYDLKDMIAKLKKADANEKTFNTSTRIPFVKLIDYYSRGMTNTEIGRFVGMTSSGVAARCRLMRKHLEEFRP